MPAQLGCGKRADAEDLVHFPFKQLKISKAGRGIRIAARNLLCFVPRRSANHVDAVLASLSRLYRKLRFVLSSSTSIYLLAQLMIWDYRYGKESINKAS